MKTRIIIINNDDSTRDLLSFHVKMAGWESYGFDYAQFSLPSLRQILPDLILLDLEDTGVGVGWSFLQILKMDDLTAKIPVVITTPAFYLSVEIRHYLLAQYIHVLSKPYDIALFLQLIRQTLESAKGAATLFSSDKSLPILIVDDSEDLRESLATILIMEGYQVAQASNGLLALDAVYYAEHCLILLDIGMPLMDGFEFLKVYDRQLRPHAPVVIISGESNIKAKALPAFVIDVLGKPFDSGGLLGIVRKHAHMGTLLNLGLV